MAQKKGKPNPKPKNGPDLTIKQDLFVTHYIETLNATEAARRSGYKGSDNTLGVIGYENLRKPKIREAIDKILEERLTSPLEILTILSKIVGGDISDLMSDHPPYHLDRKKIKQMGHLVNSVQTDITGRLKITMHNKLRAIELMGKYYDLFADRQEHSGSVELIWDMEVPVSPKKG
jgi:phage terminase small subunit